MEWLAILLSALIVGAFGFISNVVMAVAATLGFLFANWIIQALFVAWVAFEIQQVNESRARRLRFAEKRYDEAVSAIQRLCGLLNARVDGSAQYVHALAATSDWTDDREHYRDSVRAWKSEAQILLVQLIAILPRRLSYRFDQEVFPLLVKIEQKLRIIREAKEDGKTANELIYIVRSEIEAAASLSAEFSREYMLLAERRRALLEGNPPLDMTFKDVLTMAHLFKSLFVRHYL